MIGLLDYSEEELLVALEQKRKQKELESIPKMLPESKMISKMLESIPWVEKVIRDKSIGEYDDDFEHYAFETFLEIFYGSSIWTWWNRHD